MSTGKKYVKIHRMPKETIEICPPVSANQLTRSTLEDQHELGLGDALIHFIRLQTKLGTSVAGIVQYSVDGIGLNLLLHTLKPARASFGIDTHDLLNDWEAIDLSANTDRKARHAAMGRCWEVFMKDKEVFWTMIDKVYDHSTNEFILGRENPKKGLKPVMAWTESDGQVHVSYEAISDQPSNPIFRQIRGYLRTHLEEPFSSIGIRPISSVVGVYALAYFSPELRENEDIWKPRDGYGRGERIGTQNMGTTQVGVMTLRYADYFLKGRFIKEATQFVNDTAKPLVPFIP